MFDSQRHLQRQVLEAAVVGLDHVGEPRAEPLVVGADQGVEAHQVDVVLDDDQVPLLVERVQPARGVGDDQEPAAQLLHHPDREGDLPGRIAFVEVEPPLHRHDRVPGQLPADELPLVALDRRPREMGDLGVGDRGLGLDLAGQGAEARAQDDARRAARRPIASRIARDAS